ncbi:MAG TPA: IS91 family transposase [Bacteroidia bacterium]|jgi:hypothetical protein|nr:IS91 family transposase [Bacteroidia bacterium]
MELVRGRKIREILLHNQNWWLFYIAYAHLIRVDILTNIIKILACGTQFMGCHTYLCFNCNTTKVVFHTCKSRFCVSCGKKATEAWIKKHLQLLPQTTWQHVTFTFPQQLQPIFWLNRHLITKMVPIPARIITKHAMSMGVIPGIFVAVHTFGRDLKRNLHFHLSTTLSGLSIDKTTWMPKLRFNRRKLAIIKAQWTSTIITLLRNEYNSGNLVLPKNITEQQFFQYLDSYKHRPSWVVHFAKPSDNHYRTIIYLGRYLKRPPIGETRITDYDGSNVTYSYFDHHDKSLHSMALSVFDFIKRLITHIPDRYFRMVRYYNWLSTRTRNQYLPFIYQALNQIVKKLQELSWRELFFKNFGKDPLACPCCKNTVMLLIGFKYANNLSQLMGKHKILAFQ